MIDQFLVVVDEIDKNIAAHCSFEDVLRLQSNKSLNIA